MSTLATAMTRLNRGGFRQNGKCCKKIKMIILKDPGFKLFTFNQVIDKVNC